MVLPVVYLRTYGYMHTMQRATCMLPKLCVMRTCNSCETQHLESSCCAVTFRHRTDLLRIELVCGQGSSGDERSPGNRAEPRGKSSRLRHRSSVNSEHPARLLDREDSRHYSGFLSSTEELSMDVPDLLASLLELGESPLQYSDDH